MNEHTIPYFGMIDIDALEEYYVVDIKLNNDSINVDLNFDEESIDDNLFGQVRDFLANIEKYAMIAIQGVNKDIEKEESEVADYIEHHLGELEDEEIDELLKDSDKAKSVEDQLLGKLKLVRVGIYPEGQESFGVFDFSIGTDITDYLVVVNTNYKGDITEIVSES